MVDSRNPVKLHAVRSTTSEVIKKSEEKKKTIVELQPIASAVEDIIFDYTDFDFAIRSDSSKYRDGFCLFSERDRLPAIASHHILHGKEPNELKPLLESNPYLLLPVIEARNPSGQVIKQTLYQMAIGGVDKEMADLLENLLLRHHLWSWLFLHCFFY